MTKKTRKINLISLSFLLVISVMLAISGLIPVNLVNALTRKNAENILEYDADEFKVTEDYSAFVEPATKSYNGGTAIIDPTGNTKMRLDGTKKGLFIESVKTGKDAEGSSFSFKNTMSGDFSIDFRVFSEKSAQTDIMQMPGANGCETFFHDDRINPYMDLRRIGITVTSVSDYTKAFTVYVYGGQPYVFNYNAVARVAVKDEKYQVANGIKGYGLYNDKFNSYGYGTAMRGTSFSNVTPLDSETFSTTIKFDLERMCVYGVHKRMSSVYVGYVGNVGADYTEEDVLIRNLKTNCLNDTNTGDPINVGGLKTLSESDFAEGYIVSVSIESMTANDVPLTKVTKDGDGVNIDEVVGAKDHLGNYLKRTPVEGYESGYDRTAKMIIYSVNGQEIVKNDEWKVEYNDNTVLPLDRAEGISYLSKEKTAYNEFRRVEYTTDVKYDGESGSTLFYSNGKALRINAADSFYKSFGKKAKFTTNVYFKDQGLVSNYKLKVFDGKRNAKLYEKTLERNSWNTVSFEFSSAEWGSSFTDLYFEIDNNGKTEYNDLFYFSSVKYVLTSGEKINGAIRLTSSAKNISAEGNSFELNCDDYKIGDYYTIGINALSKNYATEERTKELYGDLYSNWTKYGTKGFRVGLGSNAYEYDPYSDVKEIGITVRSKTNPSQSFTIYISSGTGIKNYNTVRVGVDGESYRNGSGDKGFSYVDSSNSAVVSLEIQGGALSGSLGLRSNVSGKSSGAMDDLTSYVRFNNQTMCVERYAYNGWFKVRDLTSNQYSSNSRCQAGISTLKMLDKENFTDGNFTVEVFVSKMNTEWNRGTDNLYYLSDGKTPTQVATGYTATDGSYILKEGYDRQAIIDVYSLSFTGDEILSDKSVVTKDDEYNVTYSWTDMSEVTDCEFASVVTLSAPKLSTIFGCSYINCTAYYSYKNGTDSGSFEFVDGKGSFSPKYKGLYDITCNGVTKTITVGNKVGFNDGFKEYFVYFAGETVDFSELKLPFTTKQFVGYEIDGTQGIYSAEYVLNYRDGLKITALFVDMNMDDSAKVFVDNDKSGLQFISTISVESYNLIKNRIGFDDCEFMFSVTANLKTVSKRINANQIAYDENRNLYTISAKIGGLGKSQYALDFSAKVYFNFDTADGVSSTVISNDSANKHQYIKKLAEETLKNNPNLSENEKATLERYAKLEYKSQLSAVVDSSKGHVQGVATDGNYVYYTYSSYVIKQDIRTGETVGTITGLESGIESEHLGDSTFYDGKLYVSTVLHADDVFRAPTIESTTKASIFVTIIEADKLFGTINAQDTDIIKCVYVGRPIVELALSSHGYDADGNELDESYIATGGRFSICNGLDSVTFGPAPGRKDGKMYLTFGASLPAASYTTPNGEHIHDRADNAYYPILQFDISTWSDDYYMSYKEALDCAYKSKLKYNECKGPDKLDNVWFVYMGAYDYGAQNICYDAMQNAYIFGMYDYHGTEFTSFRGFVIDCNNAEFMEIPLSGGYKGYVAKARAGLPGKQSVQGYYYGEILWGTGVCSMQDGYYYVCENSRDSQGNFVATCILYRWGINEDNVTSASIPFERVKN